MPRSGRLAVADVLGEMAQRPFETVSARPSSGHPDALNLQEVHEASPGIEPSKNRKRA